jgi:hypothetical protein
VNDRVQSIPYGAAQSKQSLFSFPSDNAGGVNMSYSRSHLGQSCLLLREGKKPLLYWIHYAEVDFATSLQLGNGFYVILFTVCL